MELPTPDENHKTLERFVGEWAGEETLFPSPFCPEERTAVGRFVYEMGLGGFFLSSQYEESVAGEPSYAGHGVYGYDPEAGKFTMHWFDSMGGSYVKPALGSWNGNSLTFENVSPEGHARYTHTFEGDEYHFKIEVAEDGEAWTMFMAGSYLRV